MWDVTGRLGFYVFLLIKKIKIMEKKDYGKMKTKECSFFLVFLRSLGVAESYHVAWHAAGYKVQFMCVQIRHGKT